MPLILRTNKTEPLTHTELDGNLSFLDQRITALTIAEANKVVTWTEIQSKPVLFDGDYNSLSNRPSLFNGDYNNLTNTPVLFDGNYQNLTNKPSIPSNLSDLANVQDIVPGVDQVLTWTGASWSPQDKFSTDYNDLTNKPVVPTLLGDLANVSPTAPAPDEVLKWDGSQWAPGSDIGNIPTYAQVTDKAGANGPESIALGNGSGGTVDGTIAQEYAGVAIGLNAGRTDQKNNSVAIGSGAGMTTQGQDSVAIGQSAGNTTQGESAVAIGDGAGVSSQGNQTVAIGNLAGQTTQGTGGIAIGLMAGQTSQAGIAIGSSAGNTTQGEDAVAIGTGAGYNTQSTDAVAIGTGAGNTTQGAESVAIGSGAGSITQGADAVAIGKEAGTDTQGLGAIALGNEAGKTTQSTLAVAVGQYAGLTTQGTAGVAIGNLAGTISQGDSATALGQNAGYDQQGNSATAVGNLAGQTAQGASAVAVGHRAGTLNQATLAVAVGEYAGETDQGNSAIAVGQYAGFVTQGNSAVALGLSAGQTTQGTNSVAIGISAGKTTQGESAVAIGQQAGETNQSTKAIAIGEQAGNASQGVTAVALGSDAGKTSQGNDGVAIGTSAGLITQGVNSVAIGRLAANNDQGVNAIAIGDSAGKTTQGDYAIAIGNAAGETNQAANSIVMNATSTAVENTTADSFVVKPIRNAGGTHQLEYNPTTGEVTYDALGAGGYGNSDVDQHLALRFSPQDGYVLSWNTFTVDYEWVAQSSGGAGIALTDLSVTTAIAGTAALAYNNTTGVFTYTPPDLSSFSTFDGDYNSLTNKPTIPTAYTDLDVDAHLNQSNPTSGYVLSWTGTDYDWVAQSGSGGATSINTAGNTGTGSVTFASETLTATGATGQIIVDAAGFSLSFSLDADLTGLTTINSHTIPSGTGTLALTSDIPTITGDSNRVVWDLADASNSIVLDPGTIVDTAWYYGDVVSDPANPATSVVLDISAATFSGNVMGDLNGDVYNPTGANKILESGTGNLDSALTVDTANATTLNATTTNITGIATFTGGSADFTGTTTIGSWNGPVYDRTGGTLIIEDNASPTPIVHANLDGDVTGNITGDVTGFVENEFDLTGSASPNYVFNADSKYFLSNTNNPTLYLKRGERYKFENISGSHPFRIQSVNSAAGTLYNDGVTNNGGTGTVTFIPPMDAPDELYYYCTNHSSMNGVIKIVGEGSTASARTTGAATATALGDESAADITIPCAKTFTLLKIQTSHAAWVTLYIDTASRTSDASRDINTDPEAGSGVLAEVITSDGSTINITPGTIGWNNDGTPAAQVYAKVVNKSGSTQNLTVTLHYVALEV